jgi:hypothetical protein
MIDIIRTLSSYSVQFLAEINSSRIIPMDSPAVRLGTSDINLTAEHRLNMAIDYQSNGTTVLSEDWHWNMSMDGFMQSHDWVLREAMHVPMPQLFQDPMHGFDVSNRILLPRLSVTSAKADQYPQGTYPALGLEYYQAMTQAQIAQVCAQLIQLQQA